MKKKWGILGIKIEPGFFLNGYMRKRRYEEIKRVQKESPSGWISVLTWLDTWRCCGIFRHEIGQSLISGVD